LIRFCDVTDICNIGVRQTEILGFYGDESIAKYELKINYTKHAFESSGDEQTTFFVWKELPHSALAEYKKHYIVALYIVVLDKRAPQSIAHDEQATVV
jgi:hypothetical protein